jgi:hypothetical protein
VRQEAEKVYLAFQIITSPLFWVRTCLSNKNIGNGIIADGKSDR